MSSVPRQSNKMAPMPNLFYIGPYVKFTWNDLVKYCASCNQTLVEFICFFVGPLPESNPQINFRTLCLFMLFITALPLRHIIQIGKLFMYPRNQILCPPSCLNQINQLLPNFYSVECFLDGGLPKLCRALLPRLPQPNRDKHRTIWQTYFLECSSSQIMFCIPVSNICK